MFDPKRNPEGAVRLITLEQRLSDYRDDLAAEDNVIAEAERSKRRILDRILKTRREITRIEKGE